ncbi:MAG: hypothetical protein AAF399_07675 [Bacteroidota bacterium]
MMRRFFLILVQLVALQSLWAQGGEGNVKLSLQTNLLSYTNSDGYSLWIAGQSGLNQVFLGFDQAPSFDNSYYYTTGIKENARSLRLVWSRYVGTNKWYRDFFYGPHAEYHWSLLEETITRERQNTEHLRAGLMVGYHWTPWGKKDNFLQPIGILPWVSFSYRFGSSNQQTTFERTGNTHDNSQALYHSFGLNLRNTRKITSPFRAVIFFQVEESTPSGWRAK